MLKRFFREQPKATKRIKAASTRLSVEKLEDRRVFAGLLFDSMLPLGNGVNASTSSATEIDGQGNRFVTGSFEGTVDFAPNQSHVGDTDILSALGSGTDAFIAKYDSAGSLLWARRMGSPDSTNGAQGEQGRGLAVDGIGNVYVAGYFQGMADFGNQAITSQGQSDVFLVKLSASGQIDWATSYGSPANDRVGTGAIALGNDNEVYLSCRLGETTLTRLIRHNAEDGSIDWERTFDNGYNSTMYPAVDEQGNLYVTSLFFKKFDVDPGPGVYVINPTKDGIDVPNSASTFVLKLTRNGEFDWANVIQTNGTPTQSAYVMPSSIAIDNRGSILITGYYGGVVDFDPSLSGVAQLPVTDGNRMIVKLDGGGGYLWAQAFERSSDNGRSSLNSVAVDTADNIYLVGDLYGYTIDLDPSVATAVLTPSNPGSTYLRDGFLVSLTSEGQFRWANKLGNLGADVSVTGVDVSASNQVSLSGRFSGSVDFDPGVGTQVLSSAASSGMLLTLNATPGVTVSRTKGMVTSEAGRTASVEISLDSAPTADVTLSIASTDLSEGSLSVSSLTFTSANWNVPQVVRVTGVNDLLLDGDIAYTINFSPAVSTDPGYNGIQVTSLSVTNLDDDVLPTKFYVVNDDLQNLTYEYDALGGLVESYSLNSGNTTPRGAASTIAGDKTWVVDANRRVYVYNDSGASLGSWTAGTLSSTAIVEGITTNGTDVWIVDNKADRVYRYSNAAGLTAGSQNAVSSFALNGSNTNPKDIVTDGTSLWVVNDATTDRVFKYTLTGSLVGSWTIDSANQSPTGITLDPSPGSQSLWIVDNGTDRVYEYANARGRSSSSQAASVTFALAAGNTNPQGIADPPPSATQLTTEVSSPAHIPLLHADDASKSVPLIAAASTSLGFVFIPRSELNQSNFQSAIDSRTTTLPSAWSRLTTNASAFAPTESLRSVAKVSRSTSANDHDAVFSNELFDELEISLLERLATLR